MPENELRTYERAVLGRTGLRVGRLGVASSYGVPTDAVERAFEQGVNYFYWGSARTDAFGEALRRLAPQRERFVLMIQSYTRAAGLMAWSLERALGALRYDYADFLLLGLWNKPVPSRILEAARRLKARGLVKHLAVSTHKRLLVPEIASGSDFDAIHFRYNAAHPGAEKDIFPHLPATNRPGLVAYTATCWGQLIGKKTFQARIQSALKHARPLSPNEKKPTAADCYRFVLTRPEVEVCMTGPANGAEMDQALEALRMGPMTEDELEWMRRVGRAVTGK